MVCSVKLMGICDIMVFFDEVMGVDSIVMFSVKLMGDR